MALDEPGGYTRHYHLRHTGWIQLIPVILTPYNTENQYICFFITNQLPYDLANRRPLGCTDPLLARPMLRSNKTGRILLRQDWPDLT